MFVAESTAFSSILCTVQLEQYYKPFYSTLIGPSLFNTIIMFYIVQCYEIN